MLFFSIIVPTLNERSYLPKLLGCLNHQIDKDFEVIVVDGKSEDKTVEKVLQFKDKLPRLNVIESAIRNVSTQRNLGAKAARGKWLVFLDADVLLPVNFLSHIHSEILTNNVRFMTAWMEPDSTKRADKALVLIANLIIEAAALTDKPMVGGACIVIRKDTFRAAGGFRPDLKISEDHDLAQRVKQLGYGLRICRSLKYVASLRRLRREGTLEVLRKYALATKAMLLEGPVYRELFDYEMGGKVNGSRKNLSLGVLVKKQIKRMEKILS